MVLTKTREQLWEHVLTQLKPELKDETFDLWLKPLRAIRSEGNEFVLQVPNRFFSDWIKAHYQARIEALLSEMAGKTLQLSFETQGDESFSKPPQENIISTDVKLTSGSALKTHSFADELRLESKYNFKNFVVGPSNRFAEAAAEAVAKDPGRTYNPLFIYGGVGLGKTHLLHSIARHISQNNPTHRVMYVPSERFINEFIDAIRFEKMKDFRAKYRSVDCLLIDDIQFLMNKESSQEEFFYTFNTLYDLKKQIVICSDRTPKETMVGDRLGLALRMGRDRGHSGARLGNAHRHIEEKNRGLRIASARRRDLVCRHAHQNQHPRTGRRDHAHHGLLLAHVGAPLTVDTARSVLKDILTAPEHATPVSMEFTQRVVARHFNLDIRDMKSKRRTDAIAFPRQVAMYLCRVLTEFSTIEIGTAFGGKDHTTVMHACNKIKNKLSGDPYFVALVNKITQDIREESWG